MHAENSSIIEIYYCLRKVCTIMQAVESLSVDILNLLYFLIDKAITINAHSHKKVLNHFNLMFEQIHFDEFEN